MQIESIRKKLLKETVLALTGLIVVAGITYFLDDYALGYRAETENMKKQVDGKINDTKKLQEKFVKVQTHTGLYEEYLKQSQQGGMSVEPSMVVSRLSELANKYYIHSGGNKITVGKPEELKDDRYNTATSQVIAAEVKLPFEALTDEDVYAFVRAVGESMPGIVRFKKFTIKRESKVTDQVINAITKEGKYKLVSGEVHFTVYGIRAKEPAAAANTSTLPKPNAANANP